MIHRLHFGLISLFLLISLPASAQKKGWQDVVQLRNGWVLRGKILSLPTDSVLEIETEGRNLFVFKRGEVIAEAREKIRVPRYYYQSGGYLNMTEVGVLRGKKFTSDWQPAGRANLYFTLQTFNGYQFNQWLGVGLTLGLDPVPGITLLPVALGLRGDLTKTRIRLYYSLDTGYALDWLSNPDQAANVDGGFLINPALGIKIPLSHTSAFTINAGFKSQRASTTIADLAGNIIRQEYRFKRATIRFGICF